MAKPKRMVPVRAVVTTGLEVGAVLALSVAGWLLIGAAGVLVVLGVFALALSRLLVANA